MLNAESAVTSGIPAVGFIIFTDLSTLLPWCSFQIALHTSEAAPQNLDLSSCRAFPVRPQFILGSQQTLDDALKDALFRLAWKNQPSEGDPAYMSGRMSSSLENFRRLLHTAAVYGGRAFFKSHSVTDKIIDFSKEPAALVRDDGYAVLGCGRDV